LYILENRRVNLGEIINMRSNIRNKRSEKPVVAFAVAVLVVFVVEIAAVFVCNY
jgi:hypothetical protein